MRNFYILALATLIGACSHQTLRCNGNLQPINVITRTDNVVTPAKAGVSPDPAKPAERRP
jgi:hypothetical protein